MNSIRPYKHRVLNFGLPVSVYRNLNNNSFSITQGKVVGHCTELVLSQVIFHVFEKGRARVTHQKRKNVHAKVQGLITELDYTKYKLEPIYYNPYTCKSFMVHNQEIEHAEFVLLKDNKIYRLSQ